MTRRRLVNIASAVSLTLCLASVVVWIRGDYRSERLAYLKSNAATFKLDECAIYTNHGYAEIAYIERTMNTRAGFNMALGVMQQTFGEQPGVLTHLTDRATSNSTYPDDGPVLNSVGFRWKRYKIALPITTAAPAATPLGKVTFSGFRLGLPLWFIAMLLGIPAILNLARRCRRWIRQTRDQCTSCGYNLTGNTSGVCPECGRLIAITSPADPAKT